MVHLFASRHEGPGFNPQGGYLCETGIFLLALSCYTGDPDVIYHCGLVWGRLHPELSLGHHADNFIIPLDLTQLFCPGFTLAAGPPSGFTTDIVGCWGGSPVESLQSHCIHTMSHWSSGLPRLLPVMRDPGSIPKGVLLWNWDSPVSIVSLRYPVVVDHGLGCSPTSWMYTIEVDPSSKLQVDWICSGLAGGGWVPWVEGCLYSTLFHMGRGLSLPVPLTLLYGFLGTLDPGSSQDLCLEQ